VSHNDLSAAFLVNLQKKLENLSLTGSLFGEEKNNYREANCCFLELKRIIRFDQRTKF
jgi:hypothetical protein